MSADDLERLRATYIEKLDEAIVIGFKLKRAMPSRPNSISLSHAETARMWAERDDKEPY